MCYCWWGYWAGGVYHDSPSQTGNDIITTPINTTILYPSSRNTTTQPVRRIRGGWGYTQILHVFKLFALNKAMTIWTRKDRTATVRIDRSINRVLSVRACASGPMYHVWHGTYSTWSYPTANKKRCNKQASPNREAEDKQDPTVIMIVSTQPNTSRHCYHHTPQQPQRETKTTIVALTCLWC